MSPDQYLTYLSSAYKAIKEADPQAKVVGFSASQDYGGRSVEYLQQMFERGALNYCDVVSFHPYTSRLDWSTPVSAGQLNRDTRALMNQYGGQDKPLWVGELYYVGLPAPAGQDDNYVQRYIQGHELARRYLLDLSTGIGRSFTIPDFFYIKSTIPSSWQALPHRTSNIIPATSFVIYNTLAKFFEGAEAAGQVNLGGTNSLYCYLKPGSVPIAATWSFDTSNTPRRLVLPNAAGKIQVLNIMGNPSVDTKVQGRDLILNLTNSPLYLQPAPLADATLTAPQFKTLLDAARIQP